MADGLPKAEDKYFIPRHGRNIRACLIPWLPIQVHFVLPNRFGIYTITKAILPALVSMPADPPECCTLRRCTAADATSHASRSGADEGRTSPMLHWIGFDGS